VPESLVEARGLTHTYGSGPSAAVALRDVSAAFDAGRLHLLMGPSGSGKTTLLSILGGLLTPGAGDVTLQGRSLRALDEKARADLRRRSIGFIFQAFRLFRALGALENVLLAMEIDGRNGAPAREKATGILESLGLGGKLARRPHELSGGEKQRVAIARALVHDPPLLLADEPTASLDAASGQQVAGILRRLAGEEGRAVIVVSHDPRLVPFAHRILRMEDGRIAGEEEATG